MDARLGLVGAVMKHEIIRDDAGKVLEVRVTLDDGRIAITGVVGGELRPHTDIPAQKAFEIEEELRGAH